MSELGYRDIDAIAWFGLLSPLNTPAPVIERLNSDVNAVLAGAELRARLITAGYVPEAAAPKHWAVAFMRKTRNTGNSSPNSA
jgi:tripartite-type tricarboxylate transporter receptor subunit TctC